MSFIAVTTICLCAAILAVMLKQYKPEYAMLITLAAGAGVLVLIVYGIVPIMDKLQSFSDKLGGMADYIGVLIKALGICYITQFGSDACKDAGETSLASKIELAGKVSIVVLSLPMLEKIMEIVVKLMG